MRFISLVVAEVTYILANLIIGVKKNKRLVIIYDIRQ
jgi:transposase-like protein